MEYLFNYPLLTLNFCGNIKKLRDLLEYINCRDDYSAKEGIFTFLFDRVMVSIEDVIANSLQEIETYLLKNNVSAQMVFIDVMDVTKDIAQVEKTQTLVAFYNTLRNKHLNSSYIIFYNVASVDVEDLNNKFKEISDVDMPGCELISPRKMSPEILELIIGKAFNRCWSWHQIEKMGVRKLEKTIAFFDIAGFTKFVQKNMGKPLWVMGQLNLYHENVIGAVYQNKGIVNNMNGDEIMAVFEGADQIQNAVNASFLILQYLACMNSKIHIGIETGVIIEGTLGTAKYNKFTLIGKTVNTAARICNPKEGTGEKLDGNQVHIGQNAMARLQEHHPDYLSNNLEEFADPKSVKCGEDEIKVYTVRKKQHVQ